jgi:hypothetical protein
VDLSIFGGKILREFLQEEAIVRRLGEDRFFVIATIEDVVEPLWGDFD